MGSYNDIINKFKTQLTKRGMADVHNKFRSADDEELEVLKDLHRIYGHSSCVYDESELDELKAYRVPDKVIDFYKNYAINDSLHLKGDVRLLSLEDIRRENAELMPGALLIKYGVITFATTIGGNAICMDLNVLEEDEPRVIIADHSIFSDRELYIYTEDKMIETTLSYDAIKKYALEINRTFSGFLEMIADESIEDVEDLLLY